MDKIKKMLKAVINGQHALRKEVKQEIQNLRREMHEKFDVVNTKFEEVNTRFDEVNARLDRQGKQLAYLEDDTPTREEHETLKKRVDKVEQLLSH